MNDREKFNRCKVKKVLPRYGEKKRGWLVAGVADAIREDVTHTQQARNNPGVAVSIIVRRVQNRQ